MAHKTKRNRLRRERKTRINKCVRILQHGIVCSDNESPTEWRSDITFPRHHKPVEKFPNIVYAESAYSALEIYGNTAMSYKDICLAFIKCGIAPRFNANKNNYPVRNRY